jgi:hypothetical protein
MMLSAGAGVVAALLWTGELSAPDAFYLLYLLLQHLDMATKCRQLKHIVLREPYFLFTRSGQKAGKAFNLVGRETLIFASVQL